MKDLAHSDPVNKALNATPRKFSIGVYTGHGPMDFTYLSDIQNPVLTAESVTDVKAKYVADPFMIQENGTWYLFFEVLNATTKQGDIGLATSRDGRKWQYQQIVLNEKFHLSYPHVFKWQGNYYMVPESRQAGTVRLYRATQFPKKWEVVGNLLVGNYVDPTIFHYKGKWWMYVCSRPYGHDELRLFCADVLLGPWTEHPKSPIVKRNRNIARPGGRVYVSGDRIIRFTQDDAPVYGIAVRAFEVKELTPTTYRETELATSPILSGSGSGWNAAGMHNIDLHELGDGNWIACVDGWRYVSPTTAGRTAASRKATPVSKLPKRKLRASTDKQKQPSL